MHSHYFCCHVSLLVEAGKQGTVMSVKDGLYASSRRSSVKVKWHALSKAYHYRRGHEGYLDVKCVTAAKGEMYYVEHLPQLCTGNHKRLWIISHQINITFVLMILKQ